jgi:predicted DsbA family dithiol-disulfide isomerase
MTSIPHPPARCISAVEVFADVTCPFAHVGLRRFVTRRAELGRDDLVLRVRAWPLELVNGEPLDPNTVAAHVIELREQIAPELFQGFDVRLLPASSLPALVLVAAAYRVDDLKGERVSLAVRSALFEEARDIGDAEVLQKIAVAHGLAAPWPDAIDTVLADWEEGTRRGVRGSPEFFVEGHGYFCPTLDISRVDGALRITPDIKGMNAFLTAVLSERGEPKSPGQTR